MKKKLLRPVALGTATALLLGVWLTLWLTTTRRVRLPFLTMMAAAPMAAAPVSTVAQGPTVIDVSSTVLHDGAKRLGMNLGGEDFYDSQQILKNLVSRNPGFEGLEWQTVLPCGKVTPSSCTDGANNGSWPEGFLDGGSYEVISGSAAGQTGRILHSTGASSQVGATIQFAAPTSRTLAAGDYIVVRKATEGNGTAGWDKQLNGGGTITTESDDLSPRTPGSQALRLSAPGGAQGATLKQYFDSTPGKSYVQLRGSYVIRFRAKGLNAGSALSVSVERAAPNGSIFRQTVPLSGQWQDYTLKFDAAEPRSSVGTVAMSFSVIGAEALLDDVSLTEAVANGTAFRNDVVSTLQRLKPGVLRYMDSGGNWGSTLDNLLAPEDARKRSGYNRYFSEANDIPIGLHDFLVLCEKLDAEPWFTMPIGFSQQDAVNLMEYLGGAPSTKYGAARAALGHSVPWTKTFKTIHLEYGNEAWNDSQPGASITDAVAYSNRATALFQAMRSSPGFATGQFNFIVDGQVVNTYLTKKILETAKGMDTIDIAPYMFDVFSDDSSIEHIFGPMFAEPQMMDTSATGDVHKQVNAAATAAHPVRVAVYETNLGTVSGTASQAGINSAVPSVGAGIAAVDHMLLMLRDLGITAQNTFQLAGADYHFNNTAGIKDEVSPVWAVVLDMGGPTNRVRPSFLAQQLANQAIRPTMLTTTIRGEDPMWNQAHSANDNVELGHVHELQSFAFTDGATDSMILLNLSRTSAHAVKLAGPCAPHGTITIQTLTSEKITDSNEQADKVRIVSREETGSTSGEASIVLPPFSMTALTSVSHGCSPQR